MRQPWWWWIHEASQLSLPPGWSPFFARCTIMMAGQLLFRCRCAVLLFSPSSARLADRPWVVAVGSQVVAGSWLVGACFITCACCGGGVARRFYDPIVGGWRSRLWWCFVTTTTAAGSATSSSCWKNTTTLAFCFAFVVPCADCFFSKQPAAGKEASAAKKVIKTKRTPAHHYNAQQARTKPIERQKNKCNVSIIIAVPLSHQ